MKLNQISQTKSPGSFGLPTLLPTFSSDVLDEEADTDAQSLCNPSQRNQ
jgi:hypothetical protein